MEKTMIVQGKKITHKDIELVRKMMDAHPSWNRTHLSRELCVLWNWYATNGQLKDMACRSFLLKLERRGHLTLPPRLYSCRKVRKRLPCPFVPHESTPIAGKLSPLLPLRIEVVKEKDLLGLFKCLLSCYHYLGFTGTVGENLKYLVFDEK
ncbi:DUF4338 domain-containing protein, partial [Candidatus Aerophobetes bacterium]|nr:DUF4338 domain-containing protein [Candidatus Aerophobetes bacterium]